ncbi:MAG: alkaline phosphatase family protein [Chloroflexi bacterium]|nr:alkaline phosphatase family protein [Chloroflexota bacterium]
MGQRIQPKRVLFVGWDGADPLIISRLLGAGKLPNLKKMTEHGFFAGLNSTIRPESPTAWTSFATGANPGLHGVFGFMRQIPASYDFAFTNTNYVDVPFFWETLGKYNKRVALLNMPMAYPARPVNGWLVCGLMTPGEDASFTFPKSLGRQLLAQGYPIDAEPLLSGENKTQYVRRMLWQVKKRTEIARQLMQKLDWDFGSVVYTELDRLQHFFWAYGDKNHPFYLESPLSNTIDDHYVALDEELGNLHAMTGNETLVIVMSDHGFTACARQFYVNAWLQHEGLLVFKKRNVQESNALLQLVRALRKSSFLRRMKRKLFRDRSLIAQMESRTFSQQVDWAKTSAWYAETGGIRINMRGREPEGIIMPGQEYEHLISIITSKILNVRDDETGKSVIKSVHRGENIYNGPEVSGAPDLIIEPFRLADDALRNIRIGSHNPLAQQMIFASSKPYSGDHSPIGVCASNELPPFAIDAIPDVSRWIMDHFGIALDDSNIKGQTKHINAYNEQSEQKLRERLKSLGYVD